MPGFHAILPKSEYVVFLESLGITDSVKLPFLAQLLSDMYQAASKLDSHLEPHGASLHSAISRLTTTENPEDVPAHCWIRALHRLGLFSDRDAHAQRFVNIGLSYAYRHKQVDTLAKVNTVALQDGPEREVVADADAGEKAAPGGIAALSHAGEREPSEDREGPAETTSAASIVPAEKAVSAGAEMGGGCQLRRCCQGRHRKLP